MVFELIFPFIRPSITFFSNESFQPFLCLCLSVVISVFCSSASLIYKLTEAHKLFTDNNRTNCFSSHHESSKHRTVLVHRICNCHQLFCYPWNVMYLLWWIYSFVSVYKWNLLYRSSSLALCGWQPHFPPGFHQHLIVTLLNTFSSEAPYFSDENYESLVFCFPRCQVFTVVHFCFLM